MWFLGDVIGTDSQVPVRLFMSSLGRDGRTSTSLLVRTSQLLEDLCHWAQYGVTFVCTFTKTKERGSTLISELRPVVFPSLRSSWVSKYLRRVSPAHRSSH